MTEFPRDGKENWTVKHNGENPDQFHLILAYMKDTLYDSSGEKATIFIANRVTAFQRQLGAHWQPRSFRLCEA